MQRGEAPQDRIAGILAGLRAQDESLASSKPPTADPRSRRRPRVAPAEDWAEPPTVQGREKGGWVPECPAPADESAPEDVQLAHGIRLSIGSAAAIGVVLLGLLAVVAYLLLLRPEPAVPPPAVASSEAADEASEHEAGLRIHVVGAVADPGVVTVPSGSRVLDAVEAAGGLLEDADVSGVNLARPAEDGEQILVPAQGEAGESDEGDAAGGADGGAPAGGGLVNINSASAAELETLPGVGPATANKIIDHREQNGPFASIEDLQDVSGIGPKRFEAIRELVRV